MGTNPKDYLEGLTEKSLLPGGIRAEEEASSPYLSRFGRGVICRREGVNAMLSAVRKLLASTLTPAAHQRSRGAGRHLDEP
jgi:hypothetical protein